MVASGAAAIQRRCAHTSSHRDFRQFQEIGSAHQFAAAGLSFRGTWSRNGAAGPDVRERVEGPPLQD
jgi:hypothetical protein